MEICISNGLKQVCKGKGIEGLYHSFEQILYPYNKFIEDCIIEYGDDYVEEMPEEELEKLRCDICETEAIDMLAKLNSQGSVTYNGYFIKLN